MEMLRGPRRPTFSDRRNFPLRALPAITDSEANRDTRVRATRKMDSGLATARAVAGAGLSVVIVQSCDFSPFTCVPPSALAWPVLLPAEPTRALASEDVDDPYGRDIKWMNIDDSVKAKK
jgi:hypothetical protein